MNEIKNEWQDSFKFQQAIFSLLEKNGFHVGEDHKQCKSLKELLKAVEAILRHVPERNLSQSLPQIDTSCNLSQTNQATAFKRENENLKR